MATDKRLDPMKDRRVPEQTPGTRCEARVETGRSISYSCTLPSGHPADEPHYSVDSAKAIKMWQEWASEKYLSEQAKEAKSVPSAPLSDFCDYEIAVESMGTVLACNEVAGHTGPHQPVLRTPKVADGSVNLFDDGLLALVNLTTFIPRGYELSDRGLGKGDFVLTKIADPTTVDLETFAQGLAKTKSLMS
jgi:hypothetical protein